MPNTNNAVRTFMPVVASEENKDIRLPSRREIRPDHAVGYDAVRANAA